MKRFWERTTLARRTGEENHTAQDSPRNLHLRRAGRRGNERLYRELGDANLLRAASGG